MPSVLRLLTDLELDLLKSLQLFSADLASCAPPNANVQPDLSATIRRVWHQWEKWRKMQRIQRAAEGPVPTEKN